MDCGVLVKTVMKKANDTLLQFNIQKIVCCKRTPSNIRMSTSGLHTTAISSCNTRNQFNQYDVIGYSRYHFCDRHATILGWFASVTYGPICAYEYDSLMRGMLV